jgi:hypothetical protein
MLRNRLAVLMRQCAQRSAYFSFTVFRDPQANRFNATGMV